VALRGVDADEVDVAELADLLPGVGEPQPAAGALDPGDMLAQQIFEAGLEHGRGALLQLADLLRHHVEAQDLETQLGHGGGMGGAEVAEANHGDLGRGHTGAPRDGRTLPASITGRPLSRTSRTPRGRSPTKIELLNGN
jgi:hypothetical protein